VSEIEKKLYGDGEKDPVRFVGLAALVPEVAEEIRREIAEEATTALIAQAEAEPSLIDFAEEVASDLLELPEGTAWQDEVSERAVRSIKRLVSRLREVEVRLVKSEGQRNEQIKLKLEWVTRAEAAEATVATLTAQVEAMRDQLRLIELLGYREGEQLGWLVAHMRGVANDALEGRTSTHMWRLFPNHRPAALTTEKKDGR
jgi:hypothetical protein